MVTIEFKIGGKELAKVLVYYGLLHEANLGGTNINCPFHGDSTPSMSIDLEKGIFFCHGCEATGDALTFIELLYPKKSDLWCCFELVRILKDDKVCKLQLSHIKKKRKPSASTMIEAKQFYYGLKRVDWCSEELTEDELKTLEYMQKRGYTAKTLNRCKAKYTYDDIYPIVFPLLDNGKFQGWDCRTTNRRVEKKRKYLYNDGFSKHNCLCGNYSNTNTVVICEGYLDYLKFKQFGYKKVVALLGWKMSDEQIKKLKEQGVRYIICALDNDACGEKGYDYVKRYFLTTRFCYPKNVKDVGEMDEATFRIADKRTRKRHKNNLLKERKKKWD